MLSSFFTFFFTFEFIGSLCRPLSLCRFLETSSSIMVYMDTTTTTTRTSTRPPVTTTTTTSRTTTTKVPATTPLVVQSPRTTSAVVEPYQTVLEDLEREDVNAAPATAKLPNLRVEYCSPLVMMDVSWPRTKQGTLAKMPCPPGSLGIYIYLFCPVSLYWPQQMDVEFCLRFLPVKEGFFFPTVANCLLIEENVIAGLKRLETAVVVNWYCTVK